MRVRFEENDDIVVDDIPNDIMAEIERRAAEKGWSPEDELRDTFIRAVMSDKFASD
jgi:plasmid stability protein